jgi:predicted HNH restriction endonuclease
VDVCHIRALADFPLSALLGEINDEANLVYLCPNHHRELDAGLLKLADIA